MQTDQRQITPKRGFIACCFVALFFFALQINAQTTELFDTIRVDSNLVDLKVSVLNLSPQGSAVSLAARDFMVLEDGAVQEISFFAAADTPFDLVLLLDLSGSTADKINLIRRSAKRFIEATRPVDRVGVITFTDVAVVASRLTSDRKLLKEAIDGIEKPTGGTNFYDALRFVVQDLERSSQEARRSAVVVMTDGVDNALPDIYGEGSRTTFDELLELVRRRDSLVFPVYLDTEKETVKRHRGSHLAYALARNQLEQLAQACGTTVYRAAKLKDLDNVYERVISDLSTIYSIGYTPSNATRDGKWRSVTVKLHDRPELVVRTKSGYYAKTDTHSLKN